MGSIPGLSETVVVRSLRGYDGRHDTTPTLRKQPQLESPSTDSGKYGTMKCYKNGEELAKDVSDYLAAAYAW